MMGRVCCYIVGLGFLMPLGSVAAATPLGTSFAMRMDPVLGPAEIATAYLDVTSGHTEIASIGAQITYDPLIVSVAAVDVVPGADLPDSWTIVFLDVSVPGKVDVVVTDVTNSAVKIADPIVDFEAVKIELVQLDLVSCNPITVGFGSGGLAAAFPVDQYTQFESEGFVIETSEATPNTPATGVLDDHGFIRGNVNDRASHILDISDVLDLANFLFGSFNLDFNCDAASDTNNDGIRNITDLVTSVHGVFGTVIMAPPNHEDPGGGIPGVVVPDGGTIPSILGCADGETCPSVQVIDGFTFQSVNTQGLYEYTHDGTGIEFVLLPGGEFQMGSPGAEAGRSPAEGPVHTVTLSPFLIAKYEVTQAQYASVMDESTVGLGPMPSANSGTAAASDQRPVEQVSFNDLQDADGFLARTDLSLPSEAQWEYACRAGQAGPFSGTGVLDDMGWHSQNSGASHHPVGTKQANQFGLFDMHGNVYEWWEDFFYSGFYDAPEAAGPDPVATSGSEVRVIRGGGFDVDAQVARSAIRLGFIPSDRGVGFGFRPARPLP